MLACWRGAKVQQLCPCFGHLAEPTNLFTPKSGVSRVIGLVYRTALGIHSSALRGCCGRARSRWMCTFGPLLPAGGVRVVTFNGRRLSPRRSFMPSVVRFRPVVCFGIRLYSRLPTRRREQLRMASMRPLSVPSSDNASPMQE